MKNNIEEIPGYIFDWIEKYSFEALEPPMKKEVLMYFGREEYNELHQGSRAIKWSETANKPMPASKKRELLNHFDGRYGRKQPVLGLLTTKVTLWKAASVMLLVAAGLLFLRVSGGQNPSSGLLAGKTDTVYITREIASKPVEILDTVYIVKEERQPPKQQENPGTEQRPDTNRYIPAQTDIHILSVEEINGISNQAKGSSIKDDTLVKKFSFVGLL